MPYSDREADYQRRKAAGDLHSNPFAGLLESLTARPPELAGGAPHPMDWAGTPMQNAMNTMETNVNAPNSNYRTPNTDPVSVVPDNFPGNHPVVNDLVKGIHQDIDTKAALAKAKTPNPDEGESEKVVRVAAIEDAEKDPTGSPEVQKRQQGLREKLQAAYEQSQRAQMEEHQRYVEMQRKEALQKFPQWKDDTKRMEHQRQIVDYATRLGYTEQELQSIVATRDLEVLDKARQWDALQMTKQTVQTKKTAPAVRKVVKSKGKPAQSTSHKKQLQQKRERLRKSGSLRDAAQFMAEMQANKAIRK